MSRVEILRIAAGCAIALIGVVLVILAQSTPSLVLALLQTPVGLLMAWSAARQPRSGADDSR